MQPMDPEPLNRGRKPRGSQKKEKEHYITPQDRVYLQLSPEARKTKYTKATRSRVDLKASRWAKKALKDLILIASAYPDKKVRRIFTVFEMVQLLDAVVEKIGPDVTDSGKYYQLLIHEIKAAMNTSQNIRKNRTRVDCNIIEQPTGNPHIK